jgi:hypothetical protein
MFWTDFRRILKYQLHANPSSCILFHILFMIVFLFCIFVLYFVYTVFLYCVVHCFSFCTVYSCLFPISVQGYRPLQRSGNTFAVNKYHIIKQRVGAAVRLSYVVRHINPNIAADAQNYFRFKCPCLYLGRSSLSFAIV